VNPGSQHRNPSDGEYVPHGNPTPTPGLHIPIRNTVGGSPLHLDKTTVRAQEPSIKQDGFEYTSQNHGSPGMVTVPLRNPTVVPGLHIPIGNTIGGAPLHLDKTTVPTHEPSIKRNGFEPTSQNHGSPGMVTVPHNPTVAPGFHIPIGNTFSGNFPPLDKTTVRVHEPSIKRDGYESTSQNHGSPGMITVPHNPTVAPGFHLPIRNSIGVPMHLDKTAVFRAGEPSIKRDDQ
jgi:hypothetical protein